MSRHGNPSLWSNIKQATQSLIAVIRRELKILTTHVRRSYASSWQFGANYCRALSIFWSTVNIDGLRDALRQASLGSSDSSNFDEGVDNFCETRSIWLGHISQRRGSLRASASRAVYHTGKKSLKLRPPYVFPAYIPHRTPNRPRSYRHRKKDHQEATRRESSPSFSRTNTFL